MSISDVVPPDDSGRDAFSRFRYQAHAIFPAALRCATNEGVASVLCEHIEDVCIEELDRVILRQIKTRNADYGGWRFADLSSASGALRSIVRAHRAIRGVDEARNIVYEIYLEGFLARDDLIRRLTRRPPAPADDVSKAIVKAFKNEPDKVPLSEAREIVRRLVVMTAHNREAIGAKNLQLLAARAGHLPANELAEIYDRVIELICKAMEGTLAADKWPAVLFAADGGSAEGVDLAAKRLDLEVLVGPLAAVVAAETPVLSGLTEADLSGATDLVRKLNLAGAEEPLIQQAKNLRAYASRRELELRARDLRGTIDSELEDLDNRLLTIGAASAGQHGGGPTPAAAVFADVLQRVCDHPEAYDPRSLFNQDPMLLMGGICQLSDECRYGWTASDA